MVSLHGEIDARQKSERDGKGGRIATCFPGIQHAALIGPKTKI
jgi:hypothetical protein